MPTRMPRTLAAALCACLPWWLAACAGGPMPSAPPDDLLPDAEFAATSVVVDPDAALALSPAMRDYLKHELRPLARQVGARKALAQSLLDRRRLQLEYDSLQTRTAAEAFEDRAGNCLSLVLMTAALAEALDLHVVFQQIDSETAWSRSGDLLAYSGHVNLVLGGGATRTAGARWDSAMVVDFLPPSDLEGLRSTAIDRATVLAMYFNNRAAESLATGAIDAAYSYTRAALRLKPQWVPAWNTLALVHQRRGDPVRAERALAQALQAEPDNTRVLANLVGLMDTAGRASEAEPLRARLRQLEPETPFAWYERGREALRLGRWEAAREAFARELARDPHHHEFHFAMAQVQARLGDLGAVRHHLALARAGSTTPALQSLYAAKLGRLDPSPRLQP